MHRPIHRAPTSIVQKVKLPTTCVDIADAVHKRHFPIHVVLDFGLLYPNFFILWIVCLLELCFSSLSPPTKLSQHPRFIPAFNNGSKTSGAIDPTPETPKTKSTTIKGDIRHHSLDDIPRPRRSWGRYRFCYIGLHRRRLVQVS